MIQRPFYTQTHASRLRKPTRTHRQKQSKTQRRRIHDLPMASSPVASTMLMQASLNLWRMLRIGNRTIRNVGHLRRPTTTAADAPRQVAVVQNDRTSNRACAVGNVGPC